ncbi:MAG: hypothetical protein Q9196_004692 [Gyalolechia fulgens]
MAHLEAAAEIENKESKANDIDGDDTLTQDDNSSPTKKAGAAKAGKGIKATKTSPKKRNAAGDDEDGSPKKKRAASKAKATVGKPGPKDDAADGKIVTSGPAEDANFKSEATDDEEVQVPATPMKGKRTQAAEPKAPRTPKTPKTPKTTGATKSKDDATPRRRTADKVADKVSLPTSWAAAGEADQELVAMKKRGESWNDIRAIKRLQIIMMALDDDEKQLLLDAKAEVESNWKNTKWLLISQKMEEKGVKSKYPVDFLLKEFKKLETDQKARTAEEGNALFQAAAKAVAGEADSDGEGEDSGEE